ncbi:MAG: hypothetical protein MJY48_05025, partial [Bacteroidales bacterium]|nr:hypothetical protein [Bacteroidales bacterium]
PVKLYRLFHHRAPEERAGGGVVGCRVYRVEDGDIERKDAGIFIPGRDIEDIRYIVELEEFSGKEHVGTGRCSCGLTIVYLGKSGYFAGLEVYGHVRCNCTYV